MAGAVAAAGMAVGTAIRRSIGVAIGMAVGQPIVSSVAVRLIVCVAWEVTVREPCGGRVGGEGVRAIGAGVGV